MESPLTHGVETVKIDGQDLGLCLLLRNGTSLAKRRHWEVGPGGSGGGRSMKHEIKMHTGRFQWPRGCPNSQSGRFRW